MATEDATPFARNEGGGRRRDLTKSLIATTSLQQFEKQPF